MIIHRNVLLGLLLAFVAVLPVNAAPSWTPAQAENLAGWIERSRSEAITLDHAAAGAVRTAIDAGDEEQLKIISRNAALKLMRAWRGQCCGERRPGWWHIGGTMSDEDMQTGLDQAVEADRLDLFLRTVRPSHPYYAELARTYSLEPDPTRRAVLAKNLARWRWLPANMGDRYLLVNIANQKVTLWERGAIAAEWRVIIGKPESRTPVFHTQVNGLVLNPWWEIPASIAAEGIGSFVRRSPAAARARGYVYQNGRYRQMPGDNNALGRVKLIMPNPYSVLLHDTSNRELFAEDKRAFSHGCIRVDQALKFAAVLLDTEEWTLADIEEQVATNRTKIVTLNTPVPLYVTYFTAEPTPDGKIEFFEDIYRRDGVTGLTRYGVQPKEVYGSQALPNSVNFLSATGADSCPN